MTKEFPAVMQRKAEVAYIRQLERVATCARNLLTWSRGEIGDDFGTTEWVTLAEELGRLDETR